jgi:hypothetical protein
VSFKPVFRLSDRRVRMKYATVDARSFVRLRYVWIWEVVVCPLDPPVTDGQPKENELVSAPDEVKYIS